MYQQRLKIKACDETDETQKFSLVNGRIFPDVNPRICVGNEVGIDGAIQKVALSLSKCYSNNYGIVENVGESETTVAPCPDCPECPGCPVCDLDNVDQNALQNLLDQAREEGRSAGFDEGMDIGYDNGFADGAQSVTCSQVTCPDVTTGIPTETPTMTTEDLVVTTVTLPYPVTTEASTGYSVTPNKCLTGMSPVKLLIPLYIAFKNLCPITLIWSFLEIFRIIFGQQIILK